MSSPPPFKLLAGMFTWGNKTKHCWVMSKSLSTTPSNVLPLHLKNFPPIIWIFTAMGLNPGYLLKSFYFTNPMYYFGLHNWCENQFFWKRTTCMYWIILVLMLIGWYNQQRGNYNYLAKIILISDYAELYILKAYWGNSDLKHNFLRFAHLGHLSAVKYIAKGN